MTKQLLNELAEPYNCQIYRIIDNNGVMCQMAERHSTWLNLWNVGWYETEQAAVFATIQHLKECNEMNIFSTNLFPYLEGLMIKDRPVTMTIKGVVNEKIASQRGTELKTTIHFKERDKALILNKTNAKQIADFFGGETDNWVGKKVTLFAEEGTWFGKHGYAVRVSDKMPKQDAPGKSKQNAAVIVEDIVEDVVDDYEAQQDALFTEEMDRALANGYSE